MRLRVLPALLSVAVISFAIDGRAQSNVALAEQLFRDATDLMKAGNASAACPKFAESQRLDPQLGTLLNLATCHEKEGKTATAWGEYSELLDQSRKRGDTARLDYTQKKLAELEPRLSRVKLDPGAQKLDTVRLDGHALGPAAWSVAIPLDPGEHAFDVESGGKQQTLKVNVEAPGTKVVAVPSFEAKNDVVQPPTTPPDEEPRRGNAQRTIGFVVGGAGLVGFGIGTIFGITAMGKKSDVDDHCNGSVCDPTGFAAQDDARSAATVSTIGFVAGGLLLAGSVVLLVTAPRSKTGTLEIQPTAGGARALLHF
jgi:hypothetical protein